ncbi:MAG: DMT family transporter [Thermoplasmata archaeon]
MTPASGAASDRTSALLFLSMSLAWGVNYLFVVVGLQYATALWLAALRAGVGALGVLVYLAIVSRSSALDARGKRDALIIGLPNTAIFLGLWFVAAPQVPAGETAILIYTFPLWVALFTPWILGGRLSGRHWSAIAVGFFGIVLISQPWALGTGTIAPIALAELLGAAVSWAFGTVVFQRRFRGSVEMREANFYQLLGGSAALFVLALAFNPTELPRSAPNLWIAVAWIGVFGTAYAYIAWFYLLARIPAATLSAYTFLVPLIALVAASIFFGESFTLAEFAGIGLVLLSIYWISTNRRPSPVAPTSVG